jgi:hypothetical protein
MDIHAEINTTTHRLIVVETGTSNSGWGKWAFPVKLSTVKLPAGAEYKHARQVNAEVIETWTVDSRSQGPKSAYGRTLEALIKELPGHAHPVAKAA